MLKKSIFPVFLLSLFVFTACKTYTEEDKQSFDQEINTFASKKGKTFKKSESGLYYCILEEGEGEFIKFTDEVSFTYKGSLLNGRVFDQKFERKPVTFEVKDLIEGWKEGMMYLKKGGKALLIVPPHLGYGDYELDAIPPHSILYFEMEIIDVL